MRFWIGLLCVFTFSCGDNSVPNGNVMPAELRLVVLDKDGKELITKGMNPRLIFIIKDGKRVYSNSALIKEFHDTTSTYKYYYEDMGTALTAANGHKTFFIDIGGKVDTIYLDIRKNEKMKDPRDGLYYYHEELLNGRPFPYDESVMPPVNIIQR